MLEAQRAAFFADLPVSLAVRRGRLARAMRMIGENADALCAALAADQTNQDAESAKRAEVAPALAVLRAAIDNVRSEEHTSELQSLMRSSYAVFCLKKKKTTHNTQSD